MGVKMNLGIMTKNHAVDPEKGFLTKSISKPYGCSTAMPPAWESKIEFLDHSKSPYGKNIETDQK